MSKSKENSRWLYTWAYRKARDSVAALINSPSQLLVLLQKVSQKSDGRAAGPLGKTLESVRILVRLVTAYANGTYRAVPLDKLALVIAALVYFVMPIDALPDFIALLGLTDDIALLAWTWGAVKEEVERFLAWELDNQHQALDLDRD